jgi:hypothetical protein
MDATVEGKNFVNTGAVSNAIVQLVNPASNTNGCYLRSCLLGVTPGAGTSTATTIYADTSAPSVVSDLTKRAILWFTAATISTTVMPYPFYLPAGTGLWLTVSGVNGYTAITYDLVS